MGADIAKAGQPTGGGRDPSVPALPLRQGPRPNMIGPAPQSQLDQFGDRTAVGLLIAQIAGLPQVEIKPSRRAPERTVGFLLTPEAASGPPEAFLLGREFAHVHPLPEGGLHATLPPDVRAAAIAAGWAEPHPLAGLPSVSPASVFIYAPRDEAEGRIVEKLVRASYAYALGQ